MTIKMTDLAAEVRKVAADNPDVLYQERAKELGSPLSDSWLTPERRLCRYQANGEGCCLVGVALANLGVPIERLAVYDGDHERSFYSVLQEFPYDFDMDSDDDFRFVWYAQMGQDEGLAWGECVA